MNQENEPTSIRLSLCCLFHQTPIKFRTTTAKYLKKLQNDGEDVRLKYISDILSDNIKSLQKAIQFCAVNGIGSFRISSQLFPCYTHKEIGYKLNQMPNETNLIENLNECRRLAKLYDIRLSMHPDQFVVLNSPNESTVANSVTDLEYHALICEFVGGDVINIHGGGVYGDKVSALKRLDENIKKLSPSVLSRLTLENDDKSYSPEDLLPICLANNVPFVYDVHHHRCTHKSKENLTDNEIAQITHAAMETWNREPLMHISSPKYGWSGNKKLMCHHDFINYDRDFPACWKQLKCKFTLDIEAKAKEKAVIRLRNQLSQNDISIWSCINIGNDLDKLKQWKTSVLFAVEDDDLEELPKSKATKLTKVSVEDCSSEMNNIKKTRKQMKTVLSTEESLPAKKRNSKRVEMKTVAEKELLLKKKKDKADQLKGKEETKLKSSSTSVSTRSSKITK